VLRVEKMSSETSVRLGDLADPALLVSQDRMHVQANGAAIELMGASWQECAAALVRQTDARGSHDEWHHRVLSCEVEPKPMRLAVHVTRLRDSSQLVLLGEPGASDLTPSPLLGEILESISDCFFALDGDGVFVYANANAAEFFGVPRSALIGTSLFTARPDEGRFTEAFNKAVHEGLAASYDARSPQGDRWLEIRGYPVEDGMACYFTDITDRVSSQERITFMAMHDSLTKLPNRQYVQDAIVRAVARARRGEPSALLFMDMDRFKIVNDTVGHAAGDAVIIEFAAVVGSCIREEDVFARFGGDEFALLLSGAGFEEAMMVSGRIHTAVGAHEFRVGSHSFSLGVSIGLTLIDGTIDVGMLMALADDAMYEAKQQGGEQTRYRSSHAETDTGQADV